MNDKILRDTDKSFNFARDISKEFVRRYNIDLDPDALTIASLIFAESPLNSYDCNTGILMYFACLQAYQKGILRKCEDESIEASVAIGAGLSELFSKGKKDEAVNKMLRLSQIQDNLWSIANREDVRKITLSSVTKALCSKTETNHPNNDYNSDSYKSPKSGCIGVLVIIIGISLLYIYAY